MSTRTRNYIKSFRKRAGLSQQELAYLVGCRNGASVSRYESLEREPTTVTTLAYEAVFRTAVSALFRGTYAIVEQNVLTRARALSKKLAKAGEPSARLAQKRAFLANLVAREHFTHPPLWEKPENTIEF
jgi:transcriptional regulator with XRE-family HTH domain